MAMEKDHSERLQKEESLRKKLEKEQEDVVAKKQSEIDSVKSEADKRVALEQEVSKKRESEIRAEGENSLKALLEKKKEAEDKLLSLESQRKAEFESLQKQSAETLSLEKENSKKEQAAQRTAMEKDHTEKLQRMESEPFENRKKLESKLMDVQRQLSNKTPDELGEAAEFVLIDELKKSFGGDVFKPIDKGAAGADLWQDVMHNGVRCGRIVFDSKDRNQWRSAYVSKLKSDQLDAKGDHAVLTTRVFPSGHRHLHTMDGVIVSHPARVIAVVSMLREQIVHVHRLNAGNVLRDKKTEELYKFINSERCSQVFDNHETLIESLFELDVAEQRCQSL